MDSRSRKLFDAIVKKELEALTKGDKLFLRARRSYLSMEQVEKFASVLENRGRRDRTKKAE